MLLVIFSFVASVVRVFAYPAEEVNFPPNVCRTEECLKTANILNGIMDKQINPCDNFYKYACGKFGEYTKDRHRPDERYSWTTNLTEKNSLKTQDFLERAAPLPHDPDTAKKIHHFYQTCLDTETREEKGIEPLKKLLRKVGLLAEAPYGKAKHFNWYTTAAKVKRALNHDFMFSVRVRSDPNTPNRRAIYLSAPDQALPFYQKPMKPSYTYSNIETNLEKIETYIKSILEVMDDCSYRQRRNQRRLKKKTVNSILEFSVKRGEMFESRWSNFEDKAITVDELQKFTDVVSTCGGAVDRGGKALINWRTYFKVLFEEVENVTLNFSKKEGDDDEQIDKIIISDIKYLRKVFSFLASKRVEAIRAALWFDTVTALSYLTTDEMRRIEENFLEVPFNKKNRKNVCLRYVQRHFRLALSQHLVSDPQVIQVKQETLEFVDNFKTALMEIINQADWIDSVTKAAAVEKVKQMRAHVSYPKWLRNDTILQHHYDYIEVFENDFFTTVLKMKENTVRNQLKQLRSNEEENENEFENVDLLEVNAYYNPTENMIIIPMSILQIPRCEFPLRSLNYGAISTTIGHEITQAFDRTGITKNAYGESSEWWEEQSLSNYENRSQCFINSYKLLQVGNVSFDGEASLHENIADNGGFRESVLAYRHWMETHQPEPSLPGFENLTQEQMLVLGFAASWCEYLPTSSLSEYEEDEHAPPQIRVLGTLINSEEFSDIWKCQKGTFMNPNKEKCRIW